MDSQLDGVILPLTRLKPKHSTPRYGWYRAFQAEDSFTCKYCHAYVHNLAALSRVQNRNHCPTACGHVTWTSIRQATAFLPVKQHAAHRTDREAELTSMDQSTGRADAGSPPQ
jgi:hypothetical protein